MTIVIEPAGVGRGLADIAAAAEALEAARAVATRQVDDLMTRWRGDAAESFAAAYDDWATAATQARAGLEALRDAVTTTRAEVGGVDEEVASRVARIVERLG